MSQEVEELKQRVSKLEELVMASDVHTRDTLKEFTDTQKLLISAVSDNTELTKKISQDTSEIREVWANAKTAFRMFDLLVKAGTWAMKYVVIPVVSIFVIGYMMANDGKPPGWFRDLLHAFS